jgi:chromosome segregation ATPase
MSLFRRSKEPPPRRPHPDARIEAELQRIISLRSTAARKESLIGGYGAEIGRLHDQLRTASRKNMDDNLYGGFRANIEPIERRIASIQGEIRKLEAEVGQVHDEIGKRIELLNDTDLAYLDHH